ncbi:MAG: AEC family transporter [Alphaproteobacteria bacterium]
MSLVATLLVIVLPVFMLVATGYGAVRAGAFPDAGINPLMKFATGFAVPCLLFRAMYELELGAAMRATHMISFYGASIACFIAVALISRRLLRRRPGAAVSAGFSALFGNTVLLGIPIMQRAYDDAAMTAMYALIAFHVPIFYSIGIFSMEILRRDGTGVAVALWQTARAIFSNPLMIGLGLGLAANLAKLPLPGPVYDAIAMLAGAALPVALFAVGGVLTRYALKAEIGEALMISVFSLVVCPALAWLLAGPVFGLPVPFVRAAVVMAAMPPGINGYVFAAMYDRAVGTAASAVLLGTALSLLSITVWLALLGGAGM